MNEMNKFDILNKKMIIDCENKDKEKEIFSSKTYTKIK